MCDRHREGTIATGNCKGWLAAIIAAVFAAGVARPATAEQRTFVPPPRTIADIAAVLDQEKPDPERVRRRQADAAAEPAAGVVGTALAQFYFRRAQARSELGRIAEAIDDLERAMAAENNPSSDLTNRIRQNLVLQYRMAGEPKRALPLLALMIRENDRPGAWGRLFHSYRWQLIIALVVGDYAEAVAAHRRAQQLLARSQSWPARVDPFRSSWAAIVQDMTARLLEARGQNAAAEAAYRRSRTLWIDAAAKAPGWPVPPPRSVMELSISFAHAYEGRTKIKQGRHAEGEADIRQALLGQLKSVGKYSPDTPVFINILAKALIEQGRYQEAEKLARTSVEICEALGYRDETQVLVSSLSFVIGALSLQQKYQEARKIFIRIDAATKNWEPSRIAALRLDASRAFVEYAIGDLERGIAIAQKFVGGTRQRVSEQHFDHALAQGVLAVGLTRARRHAEALREFRAAVPVLLSISRANEDDDQFDVAARDHRLSIIIETYMTLLARMQSAAGDVATESFSLADAIRGRSVQRAFSASSARAAANDPALAELVRKEQDFAKQLQAQLGTLNNTLTLSPEERDENALRALNAQIGNLRTERNRARQDIERKFPDYADLIDPKPPTVDEIRESLKHGETFLSFYFSRRASFVWAVPKDGAVAFASIPATAAYLQQSIGKLREALEPRVASVSEIPAFDLALAHELYALLLKPVESGWKNSRHLIVVTNGALGLLPLSLLPVEAVQLKDDSGPMFGSYRHVPWLARTHAVTMVPSAAALRTLRRLPPASDKRERLIGFGDPYFNAQQAAEATPASANSGASNMRGTTLGLRAAPQTQGVDSAELGLLPRLPDTAEELTSIALALEADPSKVLYLGKRANERTVKTAPLDKYRIVAFATHGLVPGEINGLTQPALALTAPEVADVDGDGLLTMEEILALRLDADWVLLSACNTGAGAGASAEAASGLGRAFFYAGTRALLVTNWSVHSESARQLVTDLFRRQAADGGLTRAEALRQAMMALLDGKGFSDGGKTLYSYGHPLFWAPYTIIGDGGS